MAIQKYASLEQAQVLDLKGTKDRSRTASLDKLSEFQDYRTEDGYLYARIRAISSRVNKNHDGWPSVELAGGEDNFNRYARQSKEAGFTVTASEDKQAYGFSTFLGKPIFVDHNNSNPERARGVIVDAKLHVEDHRTASELDPYYASAPDNHTPPTWVELLLEVDAKSFPHLAKAIVEGSKDSKKGIDGFSMGCFIAGTPITMADGTRKPIEEISINDEILTHTGRIEPVTFTMERQYTGTSYTIHTYGQAQPVTMTSEHPVWTQDGWINAENLNVGDHILSPTLSGVDQPGEYRFARLLGYYLAEGNMGYDRKRYADGRPVFVEWNFSAGEIDTLVEDTKQLLGQLGYKACGPYVKNNCATVRCNSPELAQRFMDYGGQHSWAKQLAPEVLRWTSDNQKEMLIAYFNGDGHFRNNGANVEAGTASEILARQLQLVATRVGYRMTPPVKQHSPSATHKRAKYNMQATLVTPHARTLKNAFVDDKGLWRRITKIESQPLKGTVYNFDVEGDDSYVAGDIAVHNCDVEKSVCSICKNAATSPDDYCKHVKLKGAEFDWINPKTGHKESKKSYEDCYGIKFFEISAVFDPADETALIRGVRASITKEAENPLPQSDMTTAPEYVDTLREEEICPVCGSSMDNGHQCEVCGYVEPPDGMDNPDLSKAQETNALQDPQELGNPAENVDVNIHPSTPDAAQPGTAPPAVPQGQPTNPQVAASVKDEDVIKIYHPRLAGKINPLERPITLNPRPATNEPNETIVSDQERPVTNRTAASLIAAVNQGERMSNATVAAEAPAGTSADKRVDVVGVGGVMDGNNESASAADTQTDVEGKGGVIDASNEEAARADSQDSLPTADPNSDDAGYNKDKTTDDSGPTKTFDNSNESDSAVTDKAFPTSSWTIQATDDRVFPTDDTGGDGGVAGGGAKSGAEPADPVGKAEKRVDLLEHVTSPSNNSGPTKTWSGTDGNGVTKQQPAVTKETLEGSDIVNLKKGYVNIVDILKIADTEVEMGIIPAEEKYERIAELEEASPETVQATAAVLARVKTAGLRKSAAIKQGGVGKVPSFRQASTVVTREADEALFL